MSEPYEIVAGPVEIYIAPVGEAFPGVATEPPGGNWTLIGARGSTNYSEDGVSVQHTESVENLRTLGSTGAVKSFRTEEDLIVGFTLNDTTLESFQNALNFNAVTTGANDKSISPYKGPEVRYRALLVRGNGKSPYDSSMNIQWEIPRVRADPTVELVYQKGEPIGLALQFMALIDLNAASDDARFGTLRAQFQ